MSLSKTPLFLKVKLEDEDEDRFKAIKDFLGVKSNSDVIRACLSHASRTLLKKHGKEDS